MAQFHQWCLSQVCLQLVGPRSTERRVVYCILSSFTWLLSTRQWWVGGWMIPFLELADKVDAILVMAWVCEGGRQQPSSNMMSKLLQAVHSSSWEIMRDSCCFWLSFWTCQVVPHGLRKRCGCEMLCAVSLSYVILSRVNGLPCPDFCAELGSPWGFPLLGLDSHHSLSLFFCFFFSLFSLHLFLLWSVGLLACLCLLKFCPCTCFGPCLRNRADSLLHILRNPWALKTGPQFLTEPTRIWWAKSSSVRNCREAQEKAFKHIVAHWNNSCWNFGDSLFRHSALILKKRHGVL